MIQYRKILELHLSHIAQRTISSSTGNARQTVSDVIKQAKMKGLEELTDAMTNQWLEDFLFPEKQAIEKGYFPINWDEIHQELMKKNVTLKLLHHEYEDKARRHHKIPYAYRTFCENYGKHAKKYKLTMPIRRKPGELIETDWAGSTLGLRDRETGETIKVYIFIATLPYSQYSYVEGFLDMKTESWLTAHINAFNYFGGVSEVLVPDNLRTGVVKSDKYDPIINEAYRELADYYQTVVVPARVRTPKDKASVEGAVGHISRQIIAALRYYQCFSLDQLNQELLAKLADINRTDFQKRKGSRQQIFEEEEKSHLHPLPRTTYKIAKWKTSKVQLNYHIQVERMYYSVPYEYVQNDVSSRLTKDLIEVYFKDIRIASHKRLKGEIGQYATNPDHMPNHHRKYLNHTPDSCLNWASDVGNQTLRLVQYLLDTTVEKKALISLMALKNLEKKYTLTEIEVASQTVLKVSTNPTLGLVKSVLERNKKKSKLTDAHPHKEPPTGNDYGFTRGANYFKGEKN